MVCPISDNCVNLLIVEAGTKVPQDEVLRVLTPRGVALVANATGGAYQKTVKPVPDNIDDWTHYMHDATNNAVAHDTAVGPLRHLQWDAAPRYSRHHEFTSSVAAMVSTNGRLFSIMDMGSRASIHTPAKWTLAARDAFNGVLLWQRPIDSCQSPLAAQRWSCATAATLGGRWRLGVRDARPGSPVSRLDAATGETLATYEGTEFTEEILHSDGSLFLLRNNESMNPAEYHPKLMVCWDEKNRTLQESEGLLLTPKVRKLVSLDAKSGEIAWRIDTPIEPLTLTVDEQNVYFHNWKRIVCLDRETARRMGIAGSLAP
jgi:hypothetical protein